MENEKWSSLFATYQSAEIEKGAIEQFENFLLIAKFTIVNIEKCSTRDVFKRYFSQHPPFSSGKKKCEFPDAFTLLSLEKFSKDNKSKVYIISEDKDMVTFCEEENGLISLEKVDQFLDLFNKEFELTQLLHDWIKINEKKIIGKLKMELEESGGFAEDWMNSQVEDVLAKKINIFDFSVIAINETSASVLAEVDLTLAASITGPDYENGVWDSEDKDWGYLEYVTKAIEICSNFELKIFFEYKETQNFLSEIVFKFEYEGQGCELEIQTENDD